MTKQPNINIFRIELEGHTASNYGTMRLLCHGVCIFKHGKMPKRNFMGARPNVMLSSIIHNDLHDSPLRTRLLGTLDYQNIPTKKEIRELLVLHQLAK